MRQAFKPFSAIASVVGFALTAAVSQAATVTVFAAASLTDALTEIAAAYEHRTGDRIVFNFAASGTLARQIELGAPADIFFAADEAKADALDAKGLLASGTRSSPLGNTLVIVTTPDTVGIDSPAGLTNAAIQRIALGDTRMVPAGTYAKAYLEKLKLWALVAPKVVPCETVRAALAAVESGNAQAGIVYKTDAAISSKVKVAFEAPAKDGPRVSYPLALVKDAPEPVAAGKFLNYLSEAEAGKVFTRRGFILLTAEKKR